MDDATWKLQDAKARFSAVVQAAAVAPQIVTRRGRRAAVVVGIETYERLRRGEAAAAPGFVDHLLAIPRHRPAPPTVKDERLPIRLRDVAFE